MKTFIALVTMMFLMACCTNPAPVKPAPRRVGPHRIVRPPASIDAKKTLTIAIIDTGFGYNGRGATDHLCKFGHKNFTSNTETLNGIPVDNHGHGTNIAGVIEDNAQGSNRPYCLVIIKYFDPKAPNDCNLCNEMKALRYAINIKADVINFSGGGESHDSAEDFLVKHYIDQGGVFIAAAGNEKSDVKVHPYYPAMSDPRVISVGNIDKQGKILPSSNYGDKVSCYEVGENVIGNGLMMTGTSQSTAVVTGKFIAGKSCGRK